MTPFPYYNMNSNQVTGIIARPKPGMSLMVGHTADLTYLRREGYDALPCDGRPYDPSAYRELGAAIGDTHGVDDETGWPLLPKKP